MNEFLMIILNLFDEDDAEMEANVLRDRLRKEPLNSVLWEYMGNPDAFRLANMTLTALRQSKPHKILTCPCGCNTQTPAQLVYKQMRLKPFLDHVANTN